MNMVLHDLFMFGLIFVVSFLIFIQKYILGLVSLFGIGVALVKYSHCFWERARIVSNEGLSVHIGRWQMLIAFFAVLVFLLYSLLLVLFLSLLIVKCSKNRIIIVGLPVFLIYF
jgi:hypothetical protein